jgi:hypothetical protein
MRLSAKIIKNYVNVNSFDYDSQWNVRAGEANQLYFQLVDLDNDGLRYMPAGTPVGVSVTFPNLDTSLVVTAIATKPSALDPSIWMVSLSSTQVPSTGNVKFEFTEATTIRRFSVLQGISVELLIDGGC